MHLAQEQPGPADQGVHGICQPTALFPHKYPEITPIAVKGLLEFSNMKHLRKARV